MSGGFNDPLVGGGGVLVYPSIHSPNFVAGSTGWSINKDGTAEFNSLTIRNGTVISGVFLLYSSAVPAKGNLVVAFAPIAGGTDSVGNVYPQGFNFGVWSASTGGLLQHFGINTSGDIFLANSSGNVILHGHTSDGSLEFYSTAGEGAGNLRESIAPATGTDSAGNTYQAGFASYTGTGLIGQLLSATLSFFLAADNTPAQVSGSGGALTVNSGKNLLAQTVSVLQLLSSGSPTGAAQAVLAAGGVPTPATTALLEVQGAIQTTSLNSIIANGNLQAQLGDIIGSAGNLLINTVGKGLRVKEGSGGKQGTVLLSAGTAVVANSNVTAASRIFLTAQDNLSTGALRVSARTAGTSFTITSSNAADSGVVAWEIFEPA